MAKYLLLRDNKQTGPYDLEDLKVMGLKAYDLVWVEGKSAAWRYPCEVEGLSSFAPVVEEQPFDRFFKKPSQTGNSVTSTPQSTSSVQNKPITEKEKRTIYVTMPAGRPVPVNRDTAPVQAQARTQAPALADKPETAAIYKKEEISSTIAPVLAPPPAIAEEKFSQSREDWKTLGELTPRTKKSTLYKILQPVGLALCVVVLLTAGVFIGMSINKNSFGFSQKMAVNQTPVNAKVEIAPANNPPLPAAGKGSGSSSGAVRPVAPDSVATIIGAVDKNGKQTPSLSGKPKKTNSFKDKTASSVVQKTPEVTPSPLKDSASMSPSVVNRDASRHSDVPADKDIIRNNISNQVSVGANKYSIGTFGGISELQLTVSNHSIYPLDLVVVEVQYIQANKKIFRTENLNFRGVGPGAALMLEAPKSARGIKVQYRITFINSKELGLSYSAI